MYLFLVALIFLPQLVKAQTENYLDFAPGNTVTTTGTISELDGTTKFTLEAEVNLDASTTWSHVLSKIVTSTQRISLQVHNGKVYCIVANGENSYRYTSGTTLQTGTWYHIAMVYNGTLSGSSKIKLYVDGVEKVLIDSNKALPSTTATNTANFIVGGNSFDGKIDDVRVWNEALTETRIDTWKNTHLDSSHPEYTNLKLYWDFDDSNTTATANASEGTSYDGTINGAAYSNIVIPTDEYLSFSPGSKVETSGTVTELNNVNEFTLEAEVNLNTLTTWTHILSKTVTSTERISLQAHNGKIYCIVANGSNSYNYTSSALLQTDTWYHLSMVYNGALTGANKVSLYINGVAQTLASSSATLPTSTSTSTAIFRVADGNKFDGKIDDVRIWNIALSATSINTWKNKHIDTSHPEYSNLKLYWDFNDSSSPNVANASEGTSYNGIITNAIYGDIPPVTVDPIVGTYLPYYKINNVTSDIFDHLTHLFYFSFGPDSTGELGRVNGSGVFTHVNSISSVQSNINTLKTWRGTRTTKIFVTIGGWVQSDYLDEVAANPIARANLAQNAKDFCITHGLDGIDIDWEGYHGAVNDTNYGLLVSDIKTALAGTDLELSVTINPDHNSLADEFSQADFIQLMSYGNRISQGTQVPLSMLQSFVTGWVNAGMEKSKIVVGLPAYAKSSDNSNLVYSEIIQTYNPGPEIDVVVHNGKSFYFNGINTIKAKSQYVLDENLLGIMFWEQGQDVATTHAKSLLNAVTEVIPVNVNPSGAKSSETNKKIELEEIVEEVLFNVYPNPFKKNINLTLQIKKPTAAKAFLYDMSGRILWKNENFQTKGVHKLLINGENLNKGIYIFKFSDGEETYVRKLVKRE